MKLINDTEKLVADTKVFITEKNEGEKIQRLLREGYLSTEAVTGEGGKLKGTH